MLRHPARLLTSALVLGAALSATTLTTATATATAADHTVRVVVRPVTSAGAPAAGYTVSRESGAATCDGQAVTAVDPGIDTCFPSAAYLPSCWRSTRHTVLCLRAVAERRLVRMRYSGSYVSQGVLRRRSPQALTLTNGSTCTIRVGGAWGQAPGHPTWLGFYSCSNGAVYGPPDGDGIDRSQPVWRVHLLRSDGSVVTRRVARATYVGNAAA